jgi:TrmH family RNA methyltransferase
MTMKPDEQVRAPNPVAASARGGAPGPRTLVVSSVRNPLIRDIRRAIARGVLTEQGLAVAESFHLLEEALRSDREVPCVVAAASVESTVESHVRGLRNLRLAVLPDELFAEISSTETSQGVIALVRPPVWSLEHLFRGQALVVVLDGIQDPGNAGAVVRAAEAFGATGCVFLKGSVSPHNPKTLRASAGSLFRLPVVGGLDAAIVRAALDQRRMDLYAAMPRGKQELPAADLTRRFALVLGGEGRGVSAKLASAAIDLRIPTAGVESLNVGVAAAVILYEARRQRTLR